MSQEFHNFGRSSSDHFYNALALLPRCTTEEKKNLKQFMQIYYCKGRSFCEDKIQLICDLNDSVGIKFHISLLKK